MTVEITNPKVEAMIKEHLKLGKFADAQDVIRQSLESSRPLELGDRLNAIILALKRLAVDIEPSTDS